MPTIARTHAGMLEVEPQFRCIVDCPNLGEAHQRVEREVTRAEALLISRKGGDPSPMRSNRPRTTEAKFLPGERDPLPMTSVPVPTMRWE